MGIFIATGYVLPMNFHLFNMGGPAFLPMHIPVLIAGMVILPALAMSVGIITPILSSFLTGMAPIYLMLPIVTGVPGLVIQLIIVPASAKMIDMLGFRTHHA